KTGKLRKSLDEEQKTYIIAIAFSPDKKTAAYTAHTHSGDGSPTKPEVRIVDAQTWALKRTVEGEGSVSALAFSPDGKTLAFGGGSRYAKGTKGAYVKLWDVQTEKMKGGTKFGDEPEPKPEKLPQPKLDESPGPRSHVQCLAFSPDGKVLAAGDSLGKIRLFDGKTGKPKQELEHGEAQVMSVVFAADKRLVSAGAVMPDPNAALLEGAGAVKYWDVQKGKLLRTLDNEGSAYAVAVSPAGGHLATAGLRKEKDKRIPEILLWDAKTGKLKQTLPELSVGAYDLAFSPDGKTLAIACGTDGDLKTNEGKTTGELRFIRLK